MKYKMFSVHWKEKGGCITPHEKINKFIKENNIKVVYQNEGKDNYYEDFGPYNTMLFYEEL